ncbi:hypothetical protein [Paenibacillus silagei]|uniref:Uncharacterized protein n=1 Tax=Paenibacillus silagei TaxID=1670801 RepID=A0ABS4P128_9BACL|nr:hypothetical protein [Paenibacillus silagei]MBP2115446.1 hypothetical protein [Paenibacillus silagei]
MRLSEIASIVQDLKPEISFKIQALSNGDFRVHNYKQTIFNIDNLSQIGFIDAEIEILKGMDYIYSNKSSVDYVDVDKSAKLNLERAEQYIKKKIDSILDVAHISIPPESSESIDVKLPNFKSLKDTSKFFNDLNNILEIVVVNKDINGKVELENFESGSLWISIGLGTSAAVSIIGNIVNTALNLKSKYYETETLKAAARSLNATADAQELLVKALDESLTNVSKVHATELLENSPINNNTPEYLSKFEHVVITFTRLIYEGAEIHPALNAPKDTKDKFPSYPKLIQSNSVKELQESTQGSVEEDQQPTDEDDKESTEFS